MQQVFRNAREIGGVRRLWEEEGGGTGRTVGAGGVDEVVPPRVLMDNQVGRVLPSQKLRLKRQEATLELGLQPAIGPAWGRRRT